MLTSRFFLFRVRIDPKTGDDLFTCVNTDGEAFDEDALVGAVRQLYVEEAPLAAPDDGVLIQCVSRLFFGDSSDQIMALSYDELAEKFKLENDYTP